MDFNYQSVTGEASENLKSAVTFTNAGWDFVGESLNGTDDIWSIANGYPYLSFYTLNSFTLTYHAGNGGVIDGNDQQTVSIGMDGLSVTAQPNSGYTFLKWSDGRTDNPRIDYNVASDLTYTAEFELNTNVRQGQPANIKHNIALSGNRVSFSVPGPYKA